MKGFFVAFGFLVRFRFLPVPKIEERDLARSLYWYPLVGLILGYGVGAIYLYGFVFLGNDPLAKGLMLVLLVILKDAFHFEGLSDLVDGIHGATDPMSIREIMKDSHMGAMGGIAVIVSFAVILLALQGISSSLIPVAVGIVTMVSTTTAAILLSWEFEQLAETGLASSFMRHTNSNLALVLEVTVLLFAILLAGFSGLLLVLVAISLTVSYAHWLRWRVGGLNGDCCGALIILQEIVLFTLLNVLEFDGSLPLNVGWTWI
jgi:adenosylcobinamide-GDP ribazoletransferase